jgi:hypothetical protein
MSSSFRLLAAALCYSLTGTAEPLPLVPAGPATKFKPSPQFHVLSLHLECASISSCHQQLTPFDQRMCFIYQIYTKKDKKLRYYVGNW